MVLYSIIMSMAIHGQGMAAMSMPSRSPASRSSRHPAVKQDLAVRRVSDVCCRRMAVIMLRHSMPMCTKKLVVVVPWNQAPKIVGKIHDKS